MRQNQNVLWADPLLLDQPTKPLDQSSPLFHRVLSDRQMRQLPVPNGIADLVPVTLSSISLFSSNVVISPNSLVGRLTGDSAKRPKRTLKDISMIALVFRKHLVITCERAPTRFSPSDFQFGRRLPR